MGLYEEAGKRAKIMNEGITIDIVGVIGSGKTSAGTAIIKALAEAGFVVDNPGDVHRHEKVLVDGLMQYRTRLRARIDHAARIHALVGVA